VVFDKQVAEAQSKLCFTAGYIAAARNKNRVPAQCAVMQAAIEMQIGSTVNNLDMWLRGYDRRRDEEVAKLFPEDKFFQDKLKVE
jgi:hypothetical protein